MLREVAIWPTAVFSHLGTQTIELLPLYGVKESQGMPGKGNPSPSSISRQEQLAGTLRVPTQGSSGTCGCSKGTSSWLTSGVLAAWEEMVERGPCWRRGSGEGFLHVCHSSTEAEAGRLHGIRGQPVLR